MCVCVYTYICIYTECKRTIYYISVHYVTQSLLLNTYINVLNINAYITNTYILFNIQVGSKQL